MKGKLSDQLISEPLNTIYAKGQTGVLVVYRGTIEKKVFFEQGCCVLANSNVPEEDLGGLLIKIGKITPDQLEAAERKGSKQLLGKFLVEANILMADELTDFLVLQSQEIIYPIFNWNSGEFEFQIGAVSLRDGQKLSLSVPNLIFEGIRRINNPEIVHKGLRGLDKLIRFCPHYESKVSEIFLKPDEAFVLSRVDASTRISEILQLSPLGLEVTQKILYGFLSTGIIEFVSPVSDSPPVASTATKTRPYRPSPAPEFNLEIGSQSKEDPEDDMGTAKAEIFLMLDTAKNRNYYDLLGVSATAASDELKKSYYTLAKKFHPDRYHHLKDTELKNALEIIFSTLAQAYDTLKVPATRGSYDSKIYKLDATPSAEDKPPRVNSPSTAAGSGQQKLAELNYRQGRGYLDQQDYWSAIQAFRQSVRLEPGNARYRYYLGVALSKNPKWRREAEEHFVKAIEIEQFNAEYYIALGALYKDVGMLKRAESQFKQALQISPHNAAAQEALEGLQESNGKGSKALNSLKNLFRKR